MKLEIQGQLVHILWPKEISLYSNPLVGNYMRPAFHLLKISLLIVGVTALGGCTTMAMNSVMSSWEDRQLPEVVAAWGTPSEELNVDGQHLFLWNTYNGILASPGTSKPAQPADSKYCMRLLQVDRTDKIIYGNWEGNDCPGFFSGWRR